MNYYKQLRVTIPVQLSSNPLLFNKIVKDRVVLHEKINLNLNHFKVHNNQSRIKIIERKLFLNFKLLFQIILKLLLILKLLFLIKVNYIVTIEKNHHMNTLIFSKMGFINLFFKNILKFLILTIINIMTIYFNKYAINNQRYRIMFNQKMKN